MASDWDLPENKARDDSHGSWATDPWNAEPSGGGPKLPRKFLVVGGAALAVIIAVIVIASTSPLVRIKDALGIKHQVPSSVGCLNALQVIAEAAASVVASEATLGVVEAHSSELLRQETPDANLNGAMQEIGLLSLEMVRAIREMSTLDNETLIGSRLLVMADYMEGENQVASRWLKSSDQLQRICQGTDKE